MAQHNETGKKGEALAVEFLQKNGHKIITCNYRYSRAEIDIISSFRDLIVFTEVKTRVGKNAAMPELSVSKSKENLLAKAALHYIEQNNIDHEIRFDIVAISNNEIHHIEDAFFPSDF